MTLDLPKYEFIITLLGRGVSVGDSSDLWKLIDRTARENICSRDEVLLACTRWLAYENRNAKDLPELLSMYGQLRNEGFSHNATLNGLLGVLIGTFDISTTRAKLARALRRPNTFRIPELRLIRDD